MRVKTGVLVHALVLVYVLNSGKACQCKPVVCCCEYVPGYKGQQAARLQAVEQGWLQLAKALPLSELAGCRRRTLSAGLFAPGLSYLTVACCSTSVEGFVLEAAFSLRAVAKDG